MKKIKRLQELTEQLSKASYAYYGMDNPIMSDKEYDDLYDELSALEIELNCILAGSPTQKVQGYVLDGFEKVTHTKPMLSANKTKDTKEIESFVGDEDWYCSYKLDGLTTVIRYSEGKFVQGITRGNGIIGEDVTEQCKFIKNLPMQIPNKANIELRGECVMTWAEFDRINSTLEEPYKHPRNLAAGTLRCLDLNIVKERNLYFVAFELVSPSFTHKLEGFEALEKMGFECVQRTKGTVSECIEKLKPENSTYPVDGLIFEYNNSEYSKSLGASSKWENCRKALKWADDVYETTLEKIEWQTSKFGVIAPVAVFSPIDLAGAITTKATLHNISFIEKLQLGIGDTIEVYRANMVIPKIHNNLTRSNTWELPQKCPTCGGEVKVYNENGSKTLHCMNPDCKAKLLGKLIHFVSRDAININGLSESTLQKFIDKGWVKSFQDIIKLKDYKTEIAMLDGFGKKSADKLIEAIQDSRKTTLDRFIYSLSIPLIGRSASKDIAKICKGDINTFMEKITNDFDFAENIDGFGEIMNKSIYNWFSNNCENFCSLVRYFSFIKEENRITNNVNLSGKTFVITGSLIHYKNRDELINIIESAGGKVSGTVSAKTNYLINNDTESTSSKNNKAKQLGIPIISEQDFIKMIS